MHEPLITLVGNVGAAPRRRVLASGSVVCDFRLAATPRRQDRATGAWADGTTMWFGVTCWRALADNVTESLRPGDRVVVTGRLAAREYSVGPDTRTSWEVDAATVGLDLSRGTARLTKVDRGGAEPGGVGRGPLPEDPWTSSGEVDEQTGEVLPAQRAA